MTTAYWRCKERLYSIVDSNWDLKAVLIQVSYDQYKSFRATELQELQSFETRASEQGTKIQNTVKVNKKAVFDTFQFL